MMSLKEFRKTLKNEELTLNNSIKGGRRSGADNNTEYTTYRTTASNGDFDSEMTCDACSGIAANHQLTNG